MIRYNHISVLLQESINALAPKAGGIYIDCTLGLGGHTEYILQQTCGKAKIIALDRDENAIDIAKERLSIYGNAVSYYHTPFSNFAEVLEEEGVDSVDGIILDAGISSMQLDDKERGFSFIGDSVLDMRMDRTDTCSARSFLATVSYEDLRTIIKEYGEEPLAPKIARAIIHYREHSPIERTSQLVEIIDNVYPKKWKATARTHPATRTFQAIRIHINRELEELSTFVHSCIPYLAIGGRIAVISFHSLEDRIVKHAFKEYTTTCICPITVMRCECNHKANLAIITKKPILPTEEEIAYNPKARSAKLRVAEKI